MNLQPEKLSETNHILHQKRIKVSEIKACLDSLELTTDSKQRNGLIGQLRQMCRDKYGLVNKGLRKRAWPQLLNLDLVMQQDSV